MVMTPFERSPLCVNVHKIVEEQQFHSDLDSGVSNYSDISPQSPSPNDGHVESVIEEVLPLMEEQLAIRLDPSYEITSNVTNRLDGSITIRLKVNKGGPGQLPRCNRRKPSTTPALPSFTTTPDGIITDENYKRQADTKQMLSERTQNRIQRYLQEESKSFAALSENPDAAAWRLFRNIFDAISECRHHQEGIVYETQEQINQRLGVNRSPLINYKLENFLPTEVINFVHECRDNFWQTTDKQHTKVQWQKKFDQVLAFWMTASNFEKIPLSED